MNALPESAALSPSEPTPPEPTRRLWWTNVAAMAAIFWLAGAVLSGAWYETPPAHLTCAAISAGLMGLFFMAYLATFRRGGQSARWLSRLGATTGLSTFLLATLPLAIYTRAAGWQASTTALWIVLVLTIALSFMTWLENRRWASELEVWAARAREEPAEPRRLQFTLREILGAMLAFGVLIGSSRAYLGRVQGEFGEHLTRQQSPLRVPAGALDVCFRGNADQELWVEFNVSEAAFLEWAKSPPVFRAARAAQVEMTAIDEPVQFSRYRQSVPFTPDWIEVTSGWYYYWQDGEQGCYFVYDRDTERVYYYSHAE